MPGVALVGLPTDRNSSHLRGAAGAPASIRAQLWTAASNPYSESGLNLREPGVLFDAGDLELQENASDFEAIAGAVAALVARGYGVLSLGGDHSVTYPVVAAHARTYPRLNVVHFDAHPDLYPDFDGNPFSHASPFARILENVPVASLVQIGIRTMTPVQRGVAERYGVRVFSPDQLEEAREALLDGPTYVTLDLDGLDPAFAPGVSHREAGGLAVRDVLRLVRAIPGKVIGADVVELNPAADVDGITATVAAKFAKEFAARIYADQS